MPLESLPLQAKSVRELQQRLNEDENAGLEQFRHLFFEALERRHLAACSELLDLLCNFPTSTLVQEHEYHRCILLCEQRQFDRAEQRLQALLAQAEAPLMRARTLLALAISKDEQGRWPEAERNYFDALAAYEESRDQMGRAKVYNNLGITICFQFEQGICSKERLHEALSYHEAALAIASEEENPWEKAKNRRGMGVAHGLMGYFELALAEFQSYVSMCQELDDPSDRAVGLSDLAALALHPLGRFEEAIAALNEAIPILTAYDDALNLAEALTRRGNLHAQQSRVKDAHHDYRKAVEIVESVRIRLTAPIVQASYRATVEYVYAAPLTAHLHRGDARSAFTLAERSRARVLADLLGDQSALPHRTLPASLLDRRRHLHQILDQAYAADKAPAELPLWEQSLANVNRQMEVQDPLFASLNSTEPLTVTEVQELLPHESALLAYTTDQSDRFWILFVTRKDSLAIPIRGLSVKWLQSYIADHLDGMRRGIIVPDDRTGHLASPQHLFSNLYQNLIEPVRDLIAPKKTLYIIPTGPLYYLPLGVLAPNVKQSPPLLSGGRRIIYAPSATILFKYCHLRAASPNQHLLAVAPADDSLCVTHNSARSIAQLMDGVALCGAAAERANFLSAARQSRILAFLGHAYFDHQYPMHSRLQLSDGTLRASEILQELCLDADLVVLAACESGRGQILRGDEMLGLVRAILCAGTPSILVTLWPVHEVPTRFLMENFFEQLALGQQRGDPFDPALALARSQIWLRNLSFESAHRIMAQWQEFSCAEAEDALIDLWNMTQPGAPHGANDLPFQHPFFWASYILIGEGADRLVA